MIIVSFNHVLDVINKKSFVWCAKEQDTVRRLLQGCYCRVVAFIRLHGFHKGLRSPASASSTKLGKV